MNNFNTFLGVEQQTWQDQAMEWPLIKSKQQIKEEIWQYNGLENLDTKF